MIKIINYGTNGYQIIKQQKLKINFVNFRKYADYDNNTWYGIDIIFTLDDLTPFRI